MLAAEKEHFTLDWLIRLTRSYSCQSRVEGGDLILPLSLRGRINLPLTGSFEPLIPGSYFRAIKPTSPLYLRI